MTQLYIDMHSIPEADGGVSDDMLLACASPVRPYEEIKADYEKGCGDPEFSPVKFWNDNFITPTPSKEVFRAPPGMSLDEYRDIVRPSLIRRVSEPRGGFEIQTPYDYPKAGGRFPHFFPTDGYYWEKGCAARGDWEQVLNVVDTKAFLIRLLRRTPNGTAGFYASRPHEPRFAHSVRMVAEEFGKDALVRYLPELEMEYADWMQGEAELAKKPLGRTYVDRFLFRTPDGKIGNRYWDEADGPRFEMLAYDLLQVGAEADALGLENGTKEREEYMAAEFKKRRIVAATKWDFSPRWRDPATGRLVADMVAPIDLQAQMRYLEETLAMANMASGNEKRAFQYWQRVTNRDELIRTFYDPENRVFRDLRLDENQQSEVLSMAMAAPLYVGMATPDETIGVAASMREHFLRPGGFMVTADYSKGDQWARPWSWAGPNWDGSRAPARMAYKLGQLITKGQRDELIELSVDGREAVLHGINESFEEFRTVRERINAEEPRKGPEDEDGEYKVVDLLAMTLGISDALETWNPHDPDGCLPIGRLAVSAA